MSPPAASTQSREPPRVFVSYAHEAEEHNRWVRKLAGDLRDQGVDALLDKWRLRLGDDFTTFMDSMRTCNRVLLICTPTYARKADKGEGWVGYERQIITAELARTIATAKFVCALRFGGNEEAIPTFLQSRLYIDFRDDSAYAARLEELLIDLHGVSEEPILGPPAFTAPVSPPAGHLEAEPPIGPNPFVAEGTKPSPHSDASPPTTAPREPTAVRPKRLLRRTVAVIVGVGMSLTAGLIALDLRDCVSSQPVASPDPATTQPAPAESPEAEELVSPGQPSPEEATPGFVVSPDGKTLTLNLAPGVPMELVRVPAGEFMMGSPEAKEGHMKNESPLHDVHFAQPFYMGKYEVTQAQWRAVMGDNPSRFKGDDLPVETVSWEQCRKFSEKLSKRVGRKVRLPSEAEWEYACRARTTTPFYFGTTVSTDQANYDGRFPYAGSPKGEYRKQTTPVGTFPENAFGLFDMHGNVWEWCEDVWHDDYTGAPSDGSAWVTGGYQNRRVLRGGSWGLDVIGLRSACRLGRGPGLRYGLMGFRLAAGT